MKSPAFTTGAAKVAITPPLAIPYLSLVPRQTPFQGIHDPLYARALVCDDGETRVAVVAADALGFSDTILGPDRRFATEARERIAQVVGTRTECVMLAATHAHSTPQTTYLARLREFPAAGPWLETLIEQLASAAALAERDRRPATLRAATVPGPGIARNRRSHLSPDAVVDDTLAVLLFERDDAPPVTLLNTACHPVTVQVQPLASADFPGVATGLVERELGGVCLFLQGAAGDINPLRNTSDFADVHRYGLALGGTALAALARLSAQEVVSEARLGVATLDAELPIRELPPREPAEEAHARACRELEAATPEEWRRLAGRVKQAREVLNLLAWGTTSLRAPLQAIRIGTVGIAAIPGELFCRYGLAIKASSPAAVTLIAGYANDYLGYFVAPETFAEGGYEAAPGPWTRADGTAGERITAGVVQLLERLWNDGAI